jgi:hypothetical protein
MPYVIRPPVRKLYMTGALAIAAILTLLAPSLARADHSDGYSYVQSSCGDVAVSNPFAGFGDLFDYSLVEGGDFESGTDGWSLSRAGIVDGNESYFVGGESDSKSLSVGVFGKATSPRFCVDDRYPHFRFFARHTGGSYGLLVVRARWTEGDDVEQETLGLLGGSGYASWSPTEMLPLASMLRLTDWRRTQHVRLVFAPLAGTWQIDDVYVDPYRR